jgi:hypothetical protein
MSRPTLLRRRRRPPATLVEIAEHPRQGAAEAVIERIVRRAQYVHVTLLLADGRPAASRLDHLQAEWLELRIGDIVPVRPLREPCVDGRSRPSG